MVAGAMGHMVGFDRLTPAGRATDVRLRGSGTRSNMRANGDGRGTLRRMEDDLSRILAPDLVDDSDRVVEGALRPRTLDEYIGQREVKANLSVLLSAAKGRGEAADHVLLYGPPGLGKTTLATIIARELGVNVRYTSGPAVERAGDLAAILTTLDERDVLFIDEIHRLNRAVEEILYPAMEDFALDVMIGKGPSARSLRLSLKPFTVVGATTRAGRISSPLRDRFGATYRLDFYEEDDLAAIVDRSAADPRASRSTTARERAIARRGRGTPRIVNRLLKRTRDHAQVHGDGRVDEATATAAMRQMEIDDEGLDSTDRKLLAAIIQKFASGPVGVAGARGRARGGGRDDRGRLRAVPAPARVPRPDAAGPDRDRVGAGAPRAARLRDPAAAPRRRGHAEPVGRADRGAPKARSGPERDRRRELHGHGPAARGRRDPGTARPAAAAARGSRDAAVHAGGDERDRQSARSRRSPRGRRLDGRSGSRQRISIIQTSSPARWPRRGSYVRACSASRARAGCFQIGGRFPVSARSCSLSHG